MSDMLLSAKNLTKHFGGLAAVKDVSIDLFRGQIHAVIGPNGAGKSTLTNLVSGDLPLSAGTIELNGQNVTGWQAEKISRQGLGRSFQKTNVFLPLSVWDNVCLATQSRDAMQPWNPLGWFKNTPKHTNTAMLSIAEKAMNSSVESIISLCKLKNRMHSIAGTISHGEQRQLEIAMTLATQPQVLLLDEPLAGMGVAEAERMIELLHTLKKDHAMLLVEHDMDAVFALADRLTVMVNGQVIASDKPAAVRADAKVQAAYLGEEHA
jgi:branched-chain amino acid transport system ATP-binding protein